jgi:ABC-type transport system involved in cytochrome bd biosynthesis fused ATPase/permease subunit
MLEPLSRTLIIGNSGSGKSTLAEQLATLVAAPVIDLDPLHWETDGYELGARKMRHGNWFGQPPMNHAGSLKVYLGGSLTCL